MSETDENILIAKMVDAQANGALTDLERERFEQYVLERPERIEAYIAYVIETAELRRWASHARVVAEAEDQEPVDIDFVMELVRADAEARAAEELARQQANPAPADPNPAPARHAPEAGVQPRVIVIPSALFWSGLIAALLAVAAVVWQLIPVQTQSVPAPAPSIAEAVKPEPIGRVIEQVGAVWEDPSGLITSGGDLSPGSSIRLREGLVKLAFQNGAELILEAPATLVIHGSNATSLERGKATVVCPPSAAGFVMDTPNLKLIDYGTEFAAHVANDGSADAHVFVGRVGVQGSDPSGALTQMTLNAGNAVAHDPSSGKLMRINAQPQRFVREAEFQANLLADRDDYSRWLTHSYRLRRDADTVAYYTFDNQAEAPTRLINRASATHGTLDGVFGTPTDPGASPSWTRGRFDDKPALQFGALGNNRSRTVHVPDSGALNFAGPFTLAAWVKTPPASVVAGGGTLLSKRDAPTLHMAFQFSLFLESDPYANRMQMGMGSEVELDDLSGSFVYSNPTRLEPETWAHVAVVFDGKASTFYLNGAVVGQSDQPSPPRPTRAETPLLIGTDPYPLRADITAAPEAFMGLIDELVILKRDLSAAELHDMYLAGLPQD